MQLHGLFSILFQVGPCWTLGLSHSIHAPRMGIVTSLLQISSMNIFRVVESWYPIKMQSKIIINNRVSNKDICCLSSIGSPGEQKQFFDIVLMCHLCDFDHLSFSFEKVPPVSGSTLPLPWQCEHYLSTTASWFG